jgi:hypothetical protein
MAIPVRAEPVEAAARHRSGPLVARALRQAQGERRLWIDTMPPPPVTPASFRGPPGRGGSLSALTSLLAAEWTPEQVRGDGKFVVSGIRLNAAIAREKGLRS